jgi:predicted ATP-dependent serine protease
MESQESIMTATDESKPKGVPKATTKVKERSSRAYSVKQVINKKRKVFEFEGDFLESFGKPEQNAVWFIWGQSGNGKTRFLLQVCKYLTHFGKVDYNSLEEGACESIAKALRETNMEEVEGKFRLLDVMPFPEFVTRLSGKKQADFGVVDSVQYAGFDYEEYKKTKEQLKKKSLLFISHATGNNPKGNTADAIRYDSSIKVHVVGYVAKVVSRYGGNKPFIIWEEGAKRYWGKRFTAVKEGRYWPGQKK